MCNIAGYAGTQPAAPILLKMMLAEEGFGGGYYTGIATVHEGRIYYAKLTGDTKRLIDNTDAASLPGTVGIIHSRSKSGGGDEWAHPFVGTKNGETQLAYVANGVVGHFAPQRPEQMKIADALLAAGYDMQSRVVLDSKMYNKLSDGTTAHMSDVMCQLILSEMDRGLAPADAMAAAFCGMPSEIVGLLLSLANPDAVTFSRINYPMSVGFADHGAYLATTAIAFPEDAGEPMLLPACSSGCVYRDHMEIIPFKDPPAKVAPITARVRAEAYDAILARLEEGPQMMGALCKAAALCFDEADLRQDAPLAYDILHSLHKADKVRFEQLRVPGAFEHLDAPKIHISLV